MSSKHNVTQGKAKVNGGIIWADSATSAEDETKAFGVTDFHDLVTLLEQHPEWRADLRRLLLSEEMLTLPELVRELAEGQKRTDEAIRHLVESQARTDEQIRQLTARVDELAQRLEQLTARVEEIAERLEQLGRRVDELTAAVASLTQSLQRIGDDVAKLKEFYLEQRYYQRAPAYFGRIIRRVRAISYDDLCRILDDALDAGILTEAERDDLIDTDVVVHGRQRTDGEEVYLVVEVSWDIGTGDVSRAVERARTFTKLGWKTLPVVAGGWVNADAREAAKQDGVIVLLDGGPVVSILQ